MEIFFLVPPPRERRIGFHGLMLRRGLDKKRLMDDFQKISDIDRVTSGFEKRAGCFPRKFALSRAAYLVAEKARHENWSIDLRPV